MGVTTVLKDHGTEFIDAIKENDSKKFKDLCEKLLKYDDKISSLCTSDIRHKPSKKFACPLIMAARLEDPSIIRYMMERGVDPNFVHRTVYTSIRREMVTALHIAVDLTLYKTAAILLNANADPNIPDHNGETALIVAVKKSDWIMTQMLLSKGGNPSLADCKGNAPLHVATLYGHLQLVKTLLKHDADAYQKGFMGAMASHIAAKEGHIHLIQVFCSRDLGNINIKIPCFLDAREKAPLHLAAEYGHVETVVALLDQFKADVNLLDSEGNTPLHCVVLNPYNAACMREKDYFYATAKVLLKYRVKFNNKNSRGNTALHYAAMHRHHKIVELLLNVGANCFSENDQRQKPIDVVPENETVIHQLLKSAMSNPKQPVDISMLSLQNISFPVQTNISPRHEVSFKGNLSGIPPHLARNLNTSRSGSSLSSVFMNNSSRHHPQQSHHHRSKTAGTMQEIAPYRLDSIPTYSKVRKKYSDESIYTSQDSIHNKSTLLSRGKTSQKIIKGRRDDKNQYIKQRSASLERSPKFYKTKNDYYENLSFQDHQSPLATSEKKKYLNSRDIKESRISKNSESASSEKVKLVRVPGKPKTIEVEYSTGPITIELETVEDRLNKNNFSYSSSEDSIEIPDQKMRRHQKRREEKERIKKPDQDKSKKIVYDLNRSLESSQQMMKNESFKNTRDVNNSVQRPMQKLRMTPKDEPIYINNSKIVAELHEKSGYLEENIEEDELFDDNINKKLTNKDFKNKISTSRENLSKKDWQQMRQRQFDEDKMLEEITDEDRPEKDLKILSGDDSHSSIDSDTIEIEKKRLHELRRDSLNRAKESTESLKQRWSQDEDEGTITQKSKNKRKKKHLEEPVKPPRPSLSLIEGNNDSNNLINHDSQEDKNKISLLSNTFESNLIEYTFDNIIKMQTICYVKDDNIQANDNATLKTDQYILLEDSASKNYGEISSSEEPLPTGFRTYKKGLNIKVSGEVPKAYSMKDKDSARSAFIMHPPVRIESSSEASDADASASIDNESPERRQHGKWGKAVPIIYSHKQSEIAHEIEEPLNSNLINEAKFVDKNSIYRITGLNDVLVHEDQNKENYNLNFDKKKGSQLVDENVNIDKELIEDGKYIPFYPENYHINSDESISSLDNESFDEYSDENYSSHRKRSSIRQALNSQISRQRSGSRDRNSTISSETLNSSMENMKEYTNVPSKKIIKIKKKLNKEHIVTNLIQLEESTEISTFNSSELHRLNNIKVDENIVRKKNKRNKITNEISKTEINTDKIGKKKKIREIELTDDSMERILNDAKDMARSVVDDSKGVFDKPKKLKIKNNNNLTKDINFSVQPWADDTQPLATSETYEFPSKKTKKPKIPYMKIHSADEGEENDESKFNNDVDKFTMLDNMLKEKNRQLVTTVTEELKQKATKNELSDLDVVIPFPGDPIWKSKGKNALNKGSNILDVEIPITDHPIKKKKVPTATLR